MPTARKLDLGAYARKAHFDYFRSLSYPYVGVTVNVEITDWIRTVKERRHPFFFSFLYAVTNAANQVQEFRQRIEGDGIIEFDECASSYTVALPDESYCYCQLSCSLPFDEFLPYAAAKQEAAKKEKSLADGENAQALFFISSLPWLSYSNLIQPVPIPADSNPRITWGKYFEETGRVFIPVTVLCHHALVDGVHISRFYNNLERQLRLHAQL